MCDGWSGWSECVGNEGNVEMSVTAAHETEKGDNAPYIILRAHILHNIIITDNTNYNLL